MDVQWHTFIVLSSTYTLLNDTRSSLKGIVIQAESLLKHLFLKIVYNINIQGENFIQVSLQQKEKRMVICGL